MDPLLQNLLQAQQTALESQIQVAIARKALNVAKIEGNAGTEMLDVATQAGKAIGVGENFDATA